MAQTSNEQRDPMALLRTLRDEIKVRIHLAGMEARESFDKLDAETEKLLGKAERASRDKLEDIIEKLRKVQRTIGKH
jgi:hypothetical protein